MSYLSNPNTEAEDKLAEMVWDRFKASYLSVVDLGLHSDWADYEDYWSAKANTSESDDDPGSNNNIILPVIESQVADLVGEPRDIMATGIEPSDHLYAHDVRVISEWVLDKNEFEIKLDESERDRLKFGTSILKVWFDPHALRGRGLPKLEPVCPSNFFPDPKIKKAWQVQDCEFIVQAGFRSLFNLKKRFGKRAKAVKPEPLPAFSVSIFDGEDSENISSVVNDRALLLEHWSKEIDDEGNLYLRLVCIANGVVLYNSDWDEDKRGYKSYYKKGRYPFVVIPCYARKGMIWGMGDIELLKPVQDLINDLDDQIRMNARLLGNIQIVVGIASGINPKKWTNKPGLKIPARDPDAWKIVNPPDIPSYILTRRQEAKMESQEYSGRSDVVEGRKPGSVRAASAIMALQEAGSRRVNHKKLILQWGLSRVLELIVDMVAEHYTEEMAFRVLGGKSDDYLWFRGSDLNKIPKMIPGPPDESGESQLVPLMGQDGITPETKEAEFDLRLTIGAGLPQNKAFIYQAVLELAREGIVTVEEARLLLKDMMSFPVIDPFNPLGVFAGRNMSPEMMQTANQGQGQGFNNYGGMPVEDAKMEPSPEDIPPEVMSQLTQMMGGGNIAR